MLRSIFCLSLICLLGGCSFFRTAPKDGKENVVFVDEPLLDVEFVKSGRINESSRLKEGGRLLITPFTPGPDVEANDEVDKASLRIVRGVLDVFEKKWPLDAQDGDYAVADFDVALATEEEQESELKLHGRITEIRTVGNYKKWMLMKPRLRLSVEGWLVDVENKKTVASFQDSVEVEADVVNYGDMAQEIGRHIGQFIFKKR